MYSVLYFEMGLTNLNVIASAEY